MMPYFTVEVEKTMVYLVEVHAPDYNAAINAACDQVRRNYGDHHLIATNVGVTNVLDGKD